MAAITIATATNPNTLLEKNTIYLIDNSFRNAKGNRNINIGVNNTSGAAGILYQLFQKKTAYDDTTLSADGVINLSGTVANGAQGIFSMPPDAIGFAFLTAGVSAISMWME